MIAKFQLETYKMLLLKIVKITHINNRKMKMKKKMFQMTLIKFSTNLYKTSIAKIFHLLTMNKNKIIIKHNKKPNKF